jgi:predicted MFS family arabinose efflux permease
VDMGEQDAASRRLKRGRPHVAVSQLAITFVATVGGLFYDLDGYQSTFDISAAILCVSAVLAYIV